MKLTLTFHLKDGWKLEDPVCRRLRGLTPIRSDRLVGCFVGLVRDPGIPGRHKSGEVDVCGLSFSCLVAKFDYICIYLSIYIRQCKHVFFILYNES